MRIFKFQGSNGKEYSIVCEFGKTRNGFKHTATVVVNGDCTLGSTKICYLNRTWECYTYQSVAMKAVEKFVPKEEREAILSKLRGYDLA